MPTHAARPPRPAPPRRSRESLLLSQVGDRRVYFVHSYHGTPSEANADWVLATSGYGGEFVAAVEKGRVRGVVLHVGRGAP